MATEGSSVSSTLDDLFDDLDRDETIDVKSTDPIDTDDLDIVEMSDADEMRSQAPLRGLVFYLITY